MRRRWLPLGPAALAGARRTRRAAPRTSPTSARTALAASPTRPRSPWRSWSIRRPAVVDRRPSAPARSLPLLLTLALVLAGRPPGAGRDAVRPRRPRPPVAHRGDPRRRAARLGRRRLARVAPGDGRAPPLRARHGRAADVTRPRPSDASPAPAAARRSRAFRGSRRGTRARRSAASSRASGSSDSSRPSRQPASKASHSSSVEVVWRSTRNPAAAACWARPARSGSAAEDAAQLGASARAPTRRRRTGAGPRPRRACAGRPGPPPRRRPRRGTSRRRGRRRPARSTRPASPSTKRHARRPGRARPHARGRAPAPAASTSTPVPLAPVAATHAQQQLARAAAEVERRRRLRPPRASATSSAARGSPSGALNVRRAAREAAALVVGASGHQAPGSWLNGRCRYFQRSGSTT